jgi:hypothetical protein
MEFGMNGMDFLCGVPPWTSVFSVVKDSKTLTTEIAVFHGENTEFPLPPDDSTIPPKQKSDKVLADSSHHRRCHVRLLFIYRERS